MKKLRERKEKKLKEREEKEQRAKEEEEQREKHENESLLTPLTCMVEMKSLKGDNNAEDLYIKEQWHKQWDEEKMIEKETTTWATHEPDFNHLLMCLFYAENPKGFQGHSFSIMITMGNKALKFESNFLQPGGNDGGVVRECHKDLRAFDGIMSKTFKEISY
ncbi:hypothetical protein DEO72_LG8g1970 [Vigna unguiculata]|uniref:Uncharacterized protein n=1 Tax=Vigna unguiculata TaxID=3917 RepID=A0A4D6MS84_VIGUN|nr:hypothetical protein DEO72_LG8g1970 [Vigna unguiculata]